MPDPFLPQPPPAEFSWTRVAESGDSIRIVLAGELDLAGRSHFETALDGAQDDSDRVLLDLGALTLIDCANLAVIFTAAARSRDERAALVLLGPRGQVRRVFDVLGMSAIVAILDHHELPGNGSRVAA